MSLPYHFTDPDGDSLTVALDGDSVLITIAQENETAEVLVPAFQLRDVTEGILHALYEAAGLPVPVVMVPADEAHDEGERFDPEVARAAAHAAGGPADG